jgi:hypothetical protein
MVFVLSKLLHPSLLCSGASFRCPTWVSSSLSLKHYGKAGWTGWKGFLQPHLMFAGKAGAYPSEATFKYPNQGGTLLS